MMHNGSQPIGLQKVKEKAHGFTRGWMSSLRFGGEECMPCERTDGTT